MSVYFRDGPYVVKPFAEMFNIFIDKGGGRW
jgi:hypothetical protein